MDGVVIGGPGHGQTHDPADGEMLQSGYLHPELVAGYIMAGIWCEGENWGTPFDYEQAAQAAGNST